MKSIKNTSTFTDFLALGLSHTWTVSTIKHEIVSRYFSIIPWDVNKGVLWWTLICPLEGSITGETLITHRGVMLVQTLFCYFEGLDRSRSDRTLDIFSTSLSKRWLINFLPFHNFSLWPPWPMFSQLCHTKEFSFPRFHIDCIHMH